MQRHLRTLDMETKQAGFQVASEYTPVPADFLQVRDFYLCGPPKVPLRYQAPDLMSFNYGSGSGRPTSFSVVGKNFRFAQAPDTTYPAVLVYYAKIPALTASAPSNWLLTQHPDAYLYGSCMEVAIRTQNAQDAGYYKALFEEALGAIQASNNKGRWSGPGLAARPG